MTTLAPFYEITKEFEKENSSVSIVIPLINLLIKRLNSLIKEHNDNNNENQNSKEILEFKKTLLSNIEDRFNEIFDNENYAFSTILDPRFKTKSFNNNFKLIGKLKKMMNERLAELLDMNLSEDRQETIINKHTSKEEQKTENIERTICFEEKTKKEEKVSIWEDFDEQITLIDKKKTGQL